MLDIVKISTINRYTEYWRSENVLRKHQNASSSKFMMIIWIQNELKKIVDIEYGTNLQNYHQVFANFKQPRYYSVQHF